MACECFIALGSNLGERFLHIENACAKIEQRIGQIVKKSSLYETEAVCLEGYGGERQGDYINAVLVVSSILAPTDVLSILLKIEASMGRQRFAGQKWISRIIDLDLLAFGSEVINTEYLQLPHPRLHERTFVLLPLGEVAPDWRHPILFKTPAQMLLDVDVRTSAKRLDTLASF